MARIVGFVYFRAGDGPLLQIRAGAVDIQLTRCDTIFSWREGDFRGEAAMPVADFLLYVGRGHIELDDGDAFHLPAP